MNNQEKTNSIKRISMASNGVESNGFSSGVSIDDDGRYIIFSSSATNLVPNDNNNSTDIFIYDRTEKTVELIDLTPNNTEADAPISIGSISGNGRYITFASNATNLVANDTNGQRDIFIYDRTENTTELVSVATGGTQANDLNLFNAISDDGRYVAFESMASNLVANDTNGSRDIFVRDRVANTTERINVASNGTQANDLASLDSISDDGRYITFSSSANNLVANDNNGSSDVFVRDRVEKTTERISVATGGTQANGSSEFGSISGDGRYVAFESTASNLVANDTNSSSDIFIYDRVEQTTERINVAIGNTQPNGDSYGASISDDGRYVAFVSEADNLVADDTNERADIFVYDRIEQTTKHINGNSFPTISGNGEYVVFNSSLDDLVADDTNQAGDVFLADLNTFSSNQGNLTLDNFNTDEVHRFFQFEKGFHLYTTDDVEIDYVREKSASGELSYQYEAEKFRVLSDNKDALTGATLEGVEAVYRFFNRETGSHLYTTDEVEKAYIEKNLPNYNSEGIKYHAFETQPEGIETIPVFRLLNGNTGSHLYTIDQNELNYIQDNLPHFTMENNGEATFYVFEL